MIVISSCFFKHETALQLFVAVIFRSDVERSYFLTLSHYY